MVSAAPCCRSLLNQATVRWPNRKKASDGILSSDAHQKQNPSSDHDHGNAVDLTHDPANGVDAHEWAKWLATKRFPHVKYIISNGRIWSLERYREGWRTYNGTNPHEKHVHVSIRHEHRDTVPDWFNGYKENPEEDDELTDGEKKLLKEVHKMLTQLTAPRREDKRDVDPDHLSLADVYTLIEKRVT